MDIQREKNLSANTTHDARNFEWEKKMAFPKQK